MARYPQQPAERGSQKWLQILVNEHCQLINRVLRKSLRLDQEESVKWLSPLKDDDYAEYRDRQFIERLCITLEKVPLGSFWPRNGPQWDGLARTSRGDLILVEAKSHIPELVSDPTGAAEPSLTRIQQSLSATKQAFHSHSKADWTTCFYQYANRLAHLYLIRELNRLPAYLLLLYFVNDEEMNGPSTQSEWEGAINLLESFLGLRHDKPRQLHRYVLHEFVDVEDLKPKDN